jgi:hypothetical protein
MPSCGSGSSGSVRGRRMRRSVRTGAHQASGSGRAPPPGYGASRTATSANAGTESAAAATCSNAPPSASRGGQITIHHTPDVEKVGPVPGLSTTRWPRPPGHQAGSKSGRAEGVLSRPLRRTRDRGIHVQEGGCGYSQSSTIAGLLDRESRHFACVTANRYACTRLGW